MTEDKKCLNCSRMTVSQDEYISGMQDKIHYLEKENAELKERLKFFNAVGNTVDKQTYNAVVNENEVLKKEIEKLRNHNLIVQTYRIYKGPIYNELKDDELR